MLHKLGLVHSYKNKLNLRIKTEPIKLGADATVYCTVCLFFWPDTSIRSQKPHKRLQVCMRRFRLFLAQGTVEVLLNMCISVLSTVHVLYCMKFFVFLRCGCCVEHTVYVCSPKQFTAKKMYCWTFFTALKNVLLNIFFCTVDVLLNMSLPYTDVLLNCDDDELCEGSGYPTLHTSE